MNRPPSQAVIEAVERAAQAHNTCWAESRPRCHGCAKDVSPDHYATEVARAAEAAALGAIAGDWLIERTYGLSDEGITGWPEIHANAYRCAIEDAQSALRERADELTDTDDRNLP